MSVERQIQELKNQHNAVILAHYYEHGDIQDIADHVGDSLYLAQVGSKLDNPVVLLAGVVFMAESVKILSPQKKVLVPDLNAGCSLVDSSPADQYLQWRLENPNHIAVTYVNSSADVKAISDVICTSSNAEKVISSIPEGRPILFGPDRHLGRYLMKKTGREMKLWSGSCEVHVLFSARQLFELKIQHPDAPVLAHPECMESVLAYADVIGSTSTLLNEVKTNPAKKFIVATESGIFHQMHKLRQGVELIQAPVEGTCACNECPYMKLNTLTKVRDALTELKPEVCMNEETRQAAEVSLQRMMAISAGKSVTWPRGFAVA